MFGYVQANTALLSDEQRERYRGIYCGVCRSLHRRYGSAGALVLNYDMAFLVMLLSSACRPAGTEDAGGECRCLPHPVKKHGWLELPFTDYAADMNVFLAYYSCLDNWQDDHSVPSLAISGLLSRDAETAAERWPRQCAVVREQLGKLSALESRGGNADETSACFGALMGELFVPDPAGENAQTLRAVGTALGKFVYLMDACLDLHQDLKRRRFNPLTALEGTDFLPALKMLMGDCTAQFEKLPLHGDEELLRNILYSGVWCKYVARQEKLRGDKGDKTA